LQFKKVWEITKSAFLGKEFDYTTGSLKASLLLLSIPMILEMLMESVFAIVDIYFVSKLGDNDAVATVGLTESVLMLVESVAIGVAMAVTAMVARRIGEKDKEGAATAAGQAILLGVFLSIVLGGIAYYFAGDILRFMGGSEELIQKGSGYTKIILGFNIVLMMLFLFNGIFRGAGNAAIAMYTLYLANGINIILDPCLIFGYWIFPELGLEGAAIASVIGRGVGVLFQIYVLVRGWAIIKPKLQDLIPEWLTLKKLFSVSIGGAGQFLIQTASWIFLVRILADFGSVVLAGYTIGIRVIIFTILPSWGLSNATATLVGQNLGAKLPDRAEKTVWIAARYNAIFMFALSVIFFIIAEPTLSLFTDDEAVIKEGALCMRILFSSYIFFAYQMVLSQSFNGAGDTYTPTVINFIGGWLFQIPLAYILAITFDMKSLGVYTAIAITAILLATMQFVAFRRGKWKLVEI